MQTHEDLGLTFAAALRSFLRQDPDVIMVGEIRDLETADIAVKAALTGHLVLSTLHTNDAPSAVTRLLNMGVPPFLVAARWSSSLAQRLVRVICSRCAVAAHGRSPRSSGRPAGGVNRSCRARERAAPSARGTGFRGRAAIYEVMMPRRRAPRAHASVAPSALELRRLACADGMQHAASERPPERGARTHDHRGGAPRHAGGCDATP